MLPVDVDLKDMHANIATALNVPSAGQMWF
jgi:hypothetical protein